MVNNHYCKKHIPIYHYDLKFAISQIHEEDYFSIVLNKKFSIYAGFKKSVRLCCKFWDLIKDFDDIEIDSYEIQKGPINKWKIYITNELLEALVLDRENDWYNKKLEKKEEVSDYDF